MKDRILIIDDEEGLRFTFELILRTEGYEVHSAGSLKEGLELIAERGFDLIFADILLGAETGIDILRKVRELDLACPLVFITGYPNLGSASEAIRLGAFDYLPKPVRKETLLKVTHLGLERKRITDEKHRQRSKIEAILKNTKDAIITVDGDRMLTEFNRAAQELCEFTRDHLGKNIEQFHLSCTGGCIKAINEAVLNRQSVELHRFECRSAENQVRVATLMASPLLDQEGAFSGAVVLVRDETGTANPEHHGEKSRHCSQMVGQGEKMQAIYALIENVANVDSSILITGESGTGKELLAEAIHHSGERREKPLVKVNCAALSEGLLESELFGHVKGAFTGAIKDKVGRFQAADGGTLFLDEIGDISPTIQQRLLRVLQEREFERVGDATPIRADVRVIAATNKDLRKLIKQGKFREDLYYRLDVVEITLPPLRERKEDIPLLVNHFIQKLSSKLKKKIDAVSEDVLRLFMTYPWPGNIRQLEHTLERASIHCQGNIITRNHLPPGFGNGCEPGQPCALRTDARSERDRILEALEKMAWNKAKSARFLNMSRRTIYRKMEEYGLSKMKEA